MTRAVQFSSLGEPAEVVGVVNHELQAPDSESVQVRVILSNMNYSDLVLIRGQYGFIPELPSLAGAEGVGIIEQVGSEVTGFHPGERVSFYCLYGAWAEKVNVHQNHIVKVPEGLSNEVAAQFFTNPIAAAAMLEDAEVKKGDTILLTAAGSSVGKLLIQLAIKQEIDVIAVVRNEELKESLQKWGVKAIINSEKENVSIRVKEITNNKGVQVIFDAVAGKLANQLTYCMADGGKFIIYGALSGERIPLNANMLITKDITITSFWTHRWVNKRYKGIPDQYMLFKKKLFQNMLDWNIELPVERIYEVDEIKEAIKHFQQAGRKAKLLIRGHRFV
jgi:NADPH:quinone reductase-like Zn-dependent oxidoreductase